MRPVSSSLYTEFVMSMNVGRRSVLCWNCRGAGSKSFLRNLRELLFIHKPDVVALLEPRVSGVGADRICKLIGRENWVRAEANGFSGGI